VDLIPRTDAGGRNFRVVREWRTFLIMRLKKGIFRAGTSNVVVPEKNKAAFPPAFQSKSHLEYYASLFNSVEINRTFYKLPLPATLEKWAGQAPKDFRFTLKLWKEITHIKDLRYKPEDVVTFMRTVAPIGLKKGCLLVQFPAGLSSRNAPFLEHLLADISASNPDPAWRIAVELRNREWYTSAVYTLLNKYNACLVLHDMPLKGNNVLHPEDRFALKPFFSPEADFASKADFVFKRYHGPKGDYKGSYSPSFLEQEAAAIRSWLNQGKDVYAYFNNTAEGYAPKDVIMLNTFVERLK
jgi:uncharacterized protein YecE (DUF72 family)